MEEYRNSGDGRNNGKSYADLRRFLSFSAETPPARLTTFRFGCRSLQAARRVVEGLDRRREGGLQQDGSRSPGQSSAGARRHADLWAPQSCSKAS